ncbi:T9SS type A sorting domain-containing protein [Longibacter salinarum]|uniref:T9SS type A sorting domain-containing protein n=1 Tax=Longibacter salinarum TaxID=1850348 RepID=UPI0015CF4938|nr:T9SS type A sorting domain-containing protein [Longibacter salinarum]
MADANRVGGSLLADANIIGFNSSYGIAIEGERNVIAANYVGTDDAANDLSNDGPGIRITASNVIVGEAAGGGSVVGFNAGDGILVQNASSVSVAANYVGQTLAGDNVGNGGNGVGIVATSGNTASGNTVGYAYGGTVPGDPSPSSGAGNVVANNNGAGVAVRGAGTVEGNAMRGNSIFANAAVGIDLGNDGQTANDAQDSDTGPNQLQNFPELSAAETELTQSGDIQVRYQVDCDPANCDFGTNGLAIDLYRTSGGGATQGRTFLGSTFYAEADAGTFVTATITPPSSVTVEETDEVVALATDASGNTSEFTSTPDVLPVELAFFNGTREGVDTVLLEWTTLSESNNSGFYVEQKVDGSYQTVSSLVASQAPNGTTTEQQSYRFRVEDLEEGTTHTFRLRQVDVDGKTSYSETVDVKVGIQDAYKLEAYPNPVANGQQPTVRFAVDKSQPVTIELYNTLGQRVRTLYNDTPRVTGEFQKVQVDVNSLASGVYFIRMRGESFATTKKLVVVR